MGTLFLIGFPDRTLILGAESLPMNFMRIPMHNQLLGAKVYTLIDHKGSTTCIWKVPISVTLSTERSSLR